MENTNECLNLTYEEAVRRLEEIAALVERPDRPLDKVLEDLKEAVRLMEYCRRLLKESEDSLDRIIRPES
ncbi:MAG TPA: exodeoxyribonuclease VII small subunit [Candidatus Coprenecus stercoripullorum]|nr:exodeoxyribonuclease VII small subunit [Candidatus Coprenecus stercoripullorum]